MLSERVVRIKKIISHFLTSNIRRRIGAPCGNAYTEIKVNTVVQAIVKDPSRINSAQAAAHIYNACFHDGSSFL